MEKMTKAERCLVDAIVYFIQEASDDEMTADEVYEDIVEKFELGTKALYKVTADNGPKSLAQRQLVQNACVELIERVCHELHARSEGQLEIEAVQEEVEREPKALVDALEGAEIELAGHTYFLRSK